MERVKGRSDFKAEHHAILFGLIVRESIEKAGEDKVAPAIQKAVVRYGRQRGQRMAMRAKANNHPLSMLNYLAYGEWKVGKGETKLNFIERAPSVRVQIPKCNWHTAWHTAGLMKYGRYYCQNIDTAVLEGFNPELRLEIKCIKPDGVPYCDMTFKDAQLGPIETLTLVWKKLIRPGNSAVMKWDYHTGHVYKTLKEVLTEELDIPGEEAVSEAMSEFSARYGELAAHIVREYRDTDFNLLPIPSVSS